MKKNNYMKIINTCHALLIGGLLLFPLFLIVVLSYNTIISSNINDVNSGFFASFNSFFGDFDGYLYTEFSSFFNIVINGSSATNDFISNICAYYCYILVGEFILGLFRRIFNWIMGFIMGGDTF